MWLAQMTVILNFQLGKNGGGGDSHLKWTGPFRGLESGIGRCLVLRLKMSTVGFFTVPFRVFERETILNIMLLELVPLRGETKK